MRRIKFLKSFIVALLAVCLSLVFACGCVEYQAPATDDPTTPSDEDPSDPSEDPSEDEGDEGEDAFTVQLRIKPRSNSAWRNFDKEYYESTIGENASVWDEIKIQWKDEITGERYYSALNDDGKAANANLDGDYTITISNLPSGFTYDPNSYTCSNLNKNIDLTVYKVQSYSSKYGNYKNGTAYYYSISSTGAYSVTLTGPSEEADDELTRSSDINTAPMFAYKPSGQGTYTVTTLVDETANLVTPKINLFSGTSQYISSTGTEAEPREGGNTFTKNVVLTFNVPSDKAGNTYYFQLYSETVDAENGYPIVVDFLLQREGDYTEEKTASTKVSYDEELIENGKALSAPGEADTLTYAMRHPDIEDGMLDCTQVILNTEAGKQDFMDDNGVTGTAFKIDDTKTEVGTTENDGFYYYYEYDEDSNTLTFTDRLYIKINGDNEIIEFKTYYGSYIKVNYMPRTDAEGNKTYYNYTALVNAYMAACEELGTEVFPATEELAQFFQSYAQKESLFNDGNGIAEDMGYGSDEDSMWMFAAMYYKKSD